ncbi:hypothetical protein [Paenibacillus piri]|uniref:Uncharacterized protein n=1 Tax=Paenibacillus piri TaxID=2547395 RepID=A0A4R5KJ09_9BACL|nr:hypothetical protein [Paenibacillus piri]TDF94768.1 hypothetical protein E1757_22700 [Paenibacillus piri]
MKRNKSKLRISALLLIAILCFCTVVPAIAGVEAAPEGSEVMSSASLGTVNLSDSSYVELKDLNILPDNGGKNVAFTVSVHNNGSSDLMFSDYWLHVLTKSGNSITVSILPQDKDKNRIPPKAVQDIRFYATLNDKTDLSDLVVQFFKWDFSQPNYERILGSIAVPDGYSPVTPAGASRDVKMTETPVRTNIKHVYMNKNEKNYNVTVEYEMTNIGGRSVPVPVYQFSVRTPEGYMYPLEAKNLKDLTIDPQVQKEIELTGSIPVSVSSAGWQLVVMQNSADLKLNFAVAYYELPKVSSADGGDIGKSYTFANEAGVYTAQVTTINRLPWEDQDILTANVTLSNKGGESLPIPKLTGYYYLDDAVEIEAKLIQTDQLIGLAPGASANFQIVGKMPYTYHFSKVKLVLQEKESETKTNELLTFTNSAEMLNVPYNNIGETYTVEHVGRSSSYKVRGVRTYQGDTADTLMVMLEATNLEKRHTDITRLAANFKTPDGIVFPAAVSDIQNKVSPGGKALLFLTAALPKGVPTSGMHILVGEAVTDGKLTAHDAKPDGYINAAAYWLPRESFEVKDDLIDLDIAPYTVSINHIATAIILGELKLTFNYEIKKSLFMETNTEGRKLVIKFEDEKGNKTFTREFDFKDFEDKKPNDGTKDTKLRLGTTNNFEIKETDKDLIYKLETLKTYKMSIYDSFNGHEKLLGAKKIDWFSTTD